MTAIVGLVHDGDVWMGRDSYIDTRADDSVTYLPVVGYEGRYEVGSDGTVWSRASKFHKRTGMRRRGDFVELKLIQKKRIKYLAVNLHNEDGQKQHLVHWLVLRAFVGERQHGMEGCHWDGDPTNNRLSNLRWDTTSANQKDAIRVGKHHRGERNGNSRLKNDDIPKILSLLSEGVSSRKIGRMFGVSKTSILRFKHGKAWQWRTQQ